MTDGVDEVLFVTDMKAALPERFIGNTVTTRSIKPF